MKKQAMVATMAAMSMMSWARPDVTGQIVDENGEPLGFVNVVLLSLPDSIFIEGAMSDENGNFNITTPANQGVLRISSIGYETRYVKTTEKMVIVMEEDNQMLSEVVVNSQLPKTKLTGNSMVTGIQGSVLEKSGTAKEMLSKVPGMTLKDDELEVLGKGTPIFYINGRKVSDKDELKRISSDEVKEVEVITNPGAMYDATVTAVVRIKTIKRDGNGFGYDVDLSHTQQLRYDYSNPGATLNLRYRHKSVDVFGMANYWNWVNVNDNEAAQHSYFMDHGQLRTINQQSTLRNDWRGRGMNCNLGFNWQISDKHSVGARLERHDRFSLPNYQHQETIMEQYLKGGSDYSSQYSSTYQEERHKAPYNWEGNVYYNGSVGKLGIDLNLDFLANSGSDDRDIYDVLDGQHSNYTIADHTTNRMYAGKLVLSYPVWIGNLKAGSEVTLVNRKNEYKVAGLSLPSTSTNVDETNLAAFVEYGCMIPKWGSLSAGLRFEHVGFEYEDRLNGENSMTRYTDDFYPSVSWANQWGSWQTALSYSIKTSRPSYWCLSESMNYLNPYSIQQGDSKLKNEIRHEVSANARWQWTTLFASYERHNNTITQWSYLYDESGNSGMNAGTILIKNINMTEPMRALTIGLSASPTWGCYSPNWTAGVEKFFHTLTLADPREENGQRDVRYHHPIGFFNLNNAFRFPHSWRFECNANITTPGDVTNFRLISTSYNVSMVVQKCWLKNDALCLRASVNDIFQRNSQHIEMDCGYYTLEQKTRSRNHSLNLSLRYTFNAAKSKYKGTGAGQEAASRMGK